MNLAEHACVTGAGTVVPGWSIQEAIAVFLNRARGRALAGGDRVADRDKHKFLERIRARSGRLEDLDGELHLVNPARGLPRGRLVAEADDVRAGPVIDMRAG